MEWGEGPAELLLSGGGEVSPALEDPSCCPSEPSADHLIDPSCDPADDSSDISDDSSPDTSEDSSPCPADGFLDIFNDSSDFSEGSSPNIPDNSSPEPSDDSSLDPGDDSSCAQCEAWEGEVIKSASFRLWTGGAGSEAAENRGRKVGQG